MRIKFLHLLLKFTVYKNRTFLPEMRKCLSAMCSQFQQLQASIVYPYLLIFKTVRDSIKLILKSNVVCEAKICGLN